MPTTLVDKPVTLLDNPVPDTYGPSTLTWVGGGPTHLATEASNWSPAQAPAPGDSLFMAKGSVDIVGDALHGDVLTLGDQAASPFDVTLNLSTSEANVAVGSQSFDLVSSGDVSAHLSAGPGGQGFHASVSLADNSALYLSGSPNFMYGLTSSGGTLVNDGTVGVTDGTLNSHLSGNGEYNVKGYHDGVRPLTVSGDVDPGVVFNLDTAARAPVAELDLGKPGSFHGSVHVTGEGASDLVLKGLVADSYDIKDDVLSLYNGGAVVDTLSLVNSQPYSVAQAGGGVSLYFNGQAPMNSVVLPVHS